MCVNKNRLSTILVPHLHGDNSRGCVNPKIAAVLCSAAIYTIILSLFWPCRQGRGGEWQHFVAPNDLNPCPPPKPSAPSFPCLESAGTTLKASQMSKGGECGSHQGQAVSLHTLDTHSARVNKPQPSLICFIFHEERKSRNLKNKKNIFRLEFHKVSGAARRSEVNFSFASLYFLFYHRQ